MCKVIKLEMPLREGDVEKLKIGSRVLISGVIYTARDVAHQRLFLSIKRGESLPIDLKGAVIYYMGPSPAKPGYQMGSAGPTTSSRMDVYTPSLLENGLKGMIGKGARNKDVREAIKRFRAVYFVATGGVGALISKCIKSVKLVAYQDLGAEAIMKLEVENFPVIVANDCYGEDIFEESIKKYQR